MDLLSQATLDEFLRSNPVPENILKEQYERAKANTGGTEYHTRHILVDDEKLALSLLESLKKKKAKFEDLAKKHSKDATASKGGDLGWNIPANYVKEFADGMVTLKKGDLSPAPVKTNFGWHILKMEDVRKISFPSFDKLKGRIAREIQQQALTKYVDQLRASAKVE
ncbi:MAG: peptidylprolyl isomerase [Betaproteobacteria bacterium]|nr:peptidylprolyl isomerase [Betaproteobacteria bacterium]